MTDDNRSKRRLTNPSNPSQAGNAKETSSQSESLNDVTSILNEIEGIVAHKDQPPPSHSDQLSKQQVQSEQPRAEELLVPESIAENVEFSIDQLEAELEDAIESELGGAQELPVDVQQPESSNSTAPVPTETSPQTDESTEVLSHNLEQDNWDVPPTQGKRRPFVAALLAPITAPIERLSQRDRLVVNVAVLSLVLWVPVVWFMAIKQNATPTDLTSVVDDQTTMPTGH